MGPRGPPGPPGKPGDDVSIPEWLAASVKGPKGVCWAVMGLAPGGGIRKGETGQSESGTLSAVYTPACNLAFKCPRDCCGLTGKGNN